MTVQWGVLSTARINDKFLAGVAPSAQCDVLAVASRDARARRPMHAARDRARLWQLRGPAGRRDVEAVYISLPNSLHVEWTERAVRAGKHVLCEKPLSRRVSDVEATFDAAQSADRLLMEAFMWRHNPQTARILELVRQARSDSPRMVRAAFSFAIGAGDAANVRLSRELEGGR